MAQLIILPVAHHRTDMAWSDKTLDAVLWRFKQQTDGRRHKEVRSQHGKIPQAFAGSLPNRHRISRSRGLEPDSQEHDPAVGIRAGDFQSLHRRISDSDVAASGFHVKEIGM